MSKEFALNRMLIVIFRFYFQLLPIFWYSLLPIAFLGLYSGAIFYNNDFEKPAIWIAIYAAGMKSLWGIFGATLILGSALNTGCKQLLYKTI